MLSDGSVEFFSHALLVISLQWFRLNILNFSEVFFIKKFSFHFHDNFVQIFFSQKFLRFIIRPDYLNSFRNADRAAVVCTVQKRRRKRRAFVRTLLVPNAAFSEGSLQADAHEEGKRKKENRRLK